MGYAGFNLWAGQFLIPVFTLAILNDLAEEHLDLMLSGLINLIVTICIYLLGVRIMRKYVAWREKNIPHLLKEKRWWNRSKETKTSAENTGENKTSDESDENGQLK